VNIIVMTNVIGYIGLFLNLSSMAMKEVLYLRVLSLYIIYVIYGLLLHATPFIIGCAIAVGIHIYHIHKIFKSKKISTKIKYEIR